MTTNAPPMIGLTSIARETRGLAVDTVSRRLKAAKLAPDAVLIQGRKPATPLFLVSRLPQLLAIVKNPIA